jgi:hypothetical protein
MPARRLKAALFAAAFFTYLERKIVRLLSDRPLKQALVIAGLPDEKNHSHIKAVLAGLVERGVLSVTRDGYSPSDTLFVELARAVVGQHAS